MSFANPESTEAKQYQSRYLVNWSIVVSALVIGVKIADFDVFWFCCFVRQKLASLTVEDKCCLP
jgi:hypothetical protein